MPIDVQVRPTTEDDRADVLDTVEEAFSSGHGDGRAEVEIVESVWSLDASIAACDLVAVANKEIVGHVLASIGRLDGHAIPGIAPLAVRPDWQGQGIGTALMTELLRQLDQKRFPMVVLLGDPGYYGRFGFLPSGPRGAHYPPVGTGSPHFQVLRLGSHHEPCSGTYVYSWESPAV
jgi:putative acetyltransferase